MGKLTFSGHETFHCKNQWLKKGYDFINEGNSFNNDDAVVSLGVGKNMVSSIRFWMKAFRLIDDEGVLTDTANILFNEDNGLDKYLENKGSIWFLHYLLVTNNYASIYSLVFIDFHRKKNEFDFNALDLFIKNRCEEYEVLYNVNTVEKDINVLLRNYVNPNDDGGQIEEFSNLLIELSLVDKYTLRDEDGKKQIYYSFKHQNEEIVPANILLFCILERYIDNTIDFQDILYGDKGIGLMFCLTSQSLDKLLNEISTKHEWVVYSDDAGIKQLQIKSRPINIWSILEGYYNDEE